MKIASVIFEQLHALPPQRSFSDTLHFGQPFGRKLWWIGTFASCSDVKCALDASKALYVFENEKNEGIFNSSGWESRRMEIMFRYKVMYIMRARAPRSLARSALQDPPCPSGKTSITSNEPRYYTSGVVLQTRAPAEYIRLSLLPRRNVARMYLYM